MSLEIDPRFVEEIRQDLKALTIEVGKLSTEFARLSVGLAALSGLSERTGSIETKLAVLETKLAEHASSTERATASTRWIIGVFITLLFAVVGWLLKGGGK